MTDGVNKYSNLQEKFEDTKGVIRSLISKDRRNKKANTNFTKTGCKLHGGTCLVTHVKNLVCIQLFEQYVTLIYRRPRIHYSIKQLISFVTWNLLQGQPSFIRVYRYPNFGGQQAAIANRSFYKAEDVKMLWNNTGNALLVLTTTELSDQSYYGDQGLHYINTNGDGCLVPRCKLAFLR